MDNSIQYFDPCNLDEVTKLYCSIWKGEYISIRAKTNWAFLNSYKSTVIVLKNAEGKIIAIRGGIKWPVKTPLGDVRTYQFHGTCVHPDYRRRGYFSMLNKRFLADAKGQNFDLIFNVSVGASRKGYEKLGWKYLRGFHRLTRFNKPLKIVKTKFLNSKTVPKNNITNHNTESNMSQSLPEDYLVARERIFSNLIHTIYTEEFIKWRLSNVAEEYKIFQTADFIAIYKLKEINGIKQLIIGEVLLLNHKFKSFKRGLKRLFEQELPDMTYTYIFESHPYYKFYKWSFFLINPFNYNLNFGIRTLNQRTKDLIENKKWGMGFLDIDTF